MPKTRIVFIGQNSRFSTIPLLAALERFDVVGIVESAPRHYAPPVSITEHVYQALRTIFSTPSTLSLKRIARTNKVPYFFLDRTNSHELCEFLKYLGPDIVCVASMSQLLRKEVIEIPNYGTINLHPSLLPKYRGPNPWFWQYHQSESVGGVTVHFIDEGEDTGDIIKQAEYPIQLGMTSQAMWDVAISHGTEILLEAIEEISAGCIQTRSQRELPCPLRARFVYPNESKLIDWENWSIERVWHIMRGTQEWFNAVPQPEGRYAGHRWLVGEIEYRPTRDKPGTIHEDDLGYYVAHSQGRIRLSLRFSTVKWAKVRARRLLRWSKAEASTQGRIGGGASA